MPVGKFVCNKWHKSPRILSSIISKNFQWNKQNPSTILTYNRYYEKVGSEVKDITDDLPFEIPDTWVWTRFSQIVSFGLGKTPDRHTDKFWSSGIYPWFAISDLQEKATVYSTKEKISATALKEKFSGKLIPQGTLLMSFKLTVGRTSILGIDAVHNEAIISVFPIIPDNDATRNFLFNTLSLIVSYVETTDAIKGATLNSSKISSMFVPFPPLAEQIRIVKEIEKFEPLIAEYDKLEQQATKLDDEIYDKLKKSILQYAIQGKLVPQDPNDEPASVLLKRIRAEKKAKLGKKYVGSYIYKGDDNCYYEHMKNEDVNISDILPLDIPDTWSWVKISDIAFVTKLAGFEYTKYVAPNLQDAGVPLFKGKNIQNSKINYTFESYIPLSISNELQRSQISKKCILTPYVGTIGNIGIHDKDGIYHLGSNVGKIELETDKITTEEYVVLYLKSSYGYAELTKYKKATGQESKSIGAIREVYLPIPPPAEQKRIVKKINEIFGKL